MAEEVIEERVLAEAAVVGAEAVDQFKIVSKQEVKMLQESVACIYVMYHILQNYHLMTCHTYIGY